MSPGPEPDNFDNKISRLNDRKENLEERKAKTGNVALLANELESNRINQQIAEIDLFIAAVNT